MSAALPMSASLPTRVRLFEKTQKPTPVWLRLLLGRALAPTRDEFDRAGQALTALIRADHEDPRLEREARRRARIDPELQHADFVIHPDMGFATRPTPAFFRMARQSGEHEAQRLLPQLKAALQNQPLLKP